jgi:hypothetical protein
MIEVAIRFLAIIGLIAGAMGGLTLLGLLVFWLERKIQRYGAKE